MGEELADLSGMANMCIAYSDDGKGVQDDNMMLNAMKIAKEHHKMIVAHCEVNDLLNGGYIHKGKYAEEHNHRGICSESEWKQIERDIELAKKTGCSYHVCHISTKESVELIRQAKKDGVDITCETGPHYLVLSDKDLQEHGRFKMNPPLRDESDKEALIQGVLDGTIDMIATDHAPHSAEEKSKGLENSNMGVVGIETAFPIMYTHFVKTGVITLEKLAELLSTNANKRFGIGSDIKVGNKADITIFNLNEKYSVNPDDFLSMGRSTPFEGMEVYGKCIMTICNGKIAWEAQ
jgi:dihydroorotase